MFERELSRRAHTEVGAKKKECWKNAVMALLTVPELAGGTYVEGFVVAKVPIEHGWVETANGTIVDPTLYRGEATAYFVGVRYTMEECEAAVRAGKSLPLVYEGNGFGGFRHPGYLAAYQAALA